MTAGRRTRKSPAMKSDDLLLPGESVMDRLRLDSGGELILTDQRLLADAGSEALGPEYTLLQGRVQAGAPLEQVHSFVVGTGKRTPLLLASLALAVAGAVMWWLPAARYPALCAFSLCLIAFIVWLFWSKHFVTINTGGLKVSGRVKRTEALVFLERLQLAARAARDKKSPEQIKAAADRAGAIGRKDGTAKGA